jgi:hypothetical protein
MNMALQKLQELYEISMLRTVSVNPADLMSFDEFVYLGKMKEQRSRYMSIEE